MSEWNEFDQIQPSEELNARLLQKIETKLKKKETAMFKLNITKIAFTAVLIISMFAMPLLSNNKQFIDFAGFLNVYAAEIETPLLQIARQEELIEDAYRNGILTQEQYDEAKQQLVSQKNELQERKEEIYEEFKITDDLKLDDVLFSKDKTEDERLKNLYQEQIELQHKQTQLAKEEATLLVDYKNGKLSLDEFIAQKQDLHTTNKELSKIEDRLEQIEKSSYFSSLDAKTKQEIQAVYKDKQEIDKKLKKLAQEEKMLVHDFAKNKVTYEEYLSKKSEFLETEKELAALDEELKAVEKEIIDGAAKDKETGKPQVTTTTIPTTTVSATTSSTSAVTSAGKTDASTAAALAQIARERSKLAKALRDNDITQEVYDEKIKSLDELEAMLQALETKKNTTKNAKDTVTTKPKDNGNTKQNSNATKKPNKNY